MSGDLGHIRMGPGVIAHGMAVGEHAVLRGPGLVERKFPTTKKVAGTLMLLQGLQDGWRVAVFVTGIEGEKDDFFIGVGGIVGVVGVQLLDGGISGGTLPFIGKT